MPSHAPLPAGLKDPSRRTITNPTLKDSVHFLAYAAETSGAYFRIRVTLAPHGGTPPHRHASYTETFHALASPLPILCGDGEIVLAPGQSRTIRRGEMHRFWNPGEEVVVFEVTVAPAHAGFEQALHVLYGLAREGRVDGKGVPRGFVEGCVVAVMAEMGSDRWGWWVLWPVVWVVAVGARWWGVERRLVRLYYE